MSYMRTKEFKDAQLTSLNSAIMSKAIADQQLSPAEYDPSIDWFVAMNLLRVAVENRGAKQ